MAPRFARRGAAAQLAWLALRARVTPAYMLAETVFLKDFSVFGPKTGHFWGEMTPFLDENASLQAFVEVYTLHLAGLCM